MAKSTPEKPKSYGLLQDSRQHKAAHRDGSVLIDALVEIYCSGEKASGLTKPPLLPAGEADMDTASRASLRIVGEG